MVGGIIISMLVISALVFVFNNLSLSEKERVNNEEIMQEVEWNKRFQSFNRENLYGTDIISISNLMQDYNEKEEGYAEMEIEVEINDGIENGKSFKRGTYNLSDILEGVKKLEYENSEELYVFKTKKFKCVKVEYNNTRIYKMKFAD